MPNINISQTSTEDFKIGSLTDVEAVNNSLVLKSKIVIKNIIGENRKKVPLIANYAKGKGGVTFKVKKDTIISSLGFYNTWDSAFASVISIVDSNSNVIASTIAVAPYSEMSAFSDIEPIKLIAGETYRLECTHNRRTSFIPQNDYDSYIDFDHENFSFIKHESNLSNYVTVLPFMRSKLNEFPIFGYRQFTIDIQDVVNIGPSLIDWDETIPNGTRIIIEASCDNGSTWNQLINGGKLPNILNGVSSIFIRQNLVTSNREVTPILNKFNLFIDDKELVLFKSDVSVFSDSINYSNKVFNNESILDIFNTVHTDRTFRVFNDSIIKIDSINDNHLDKNLQSFNEIVINDNILTDVDGIEVEINYIETLDEDFIEGSLINVQSNNDSLELSKEDYYLPNTVKTLQSVSSIKPILGTKTGLTITDTGWEFYLCEDIYIKNLKWYNTHDIPLNSLVTIWDVSSNSIVVQKEVSAHHGWGISEFSEPVFLSGERKYIISVRKNLGEPYLMVPLNKVDFVPFNAVKFIGGRNISVSDNSISAMYPVDNVESINRFPSFDFYTVSNKISNGYALNGYRISRKIDLSKIEYIVASEISWNSIGHVKIETSVDNGLSWQEAENGKPVKNLTGVGKDKFLLIRETLRTISRKETPYLYDLSINISDKRYPNYNLFESSIIEVDSSIDNFNSLFDDKYEDLIIDSNSTIVTHRFVANSSSLVVSSNGVIDIPLLYSYSSIEVDSISRNYVNRYLENKSEIKINTDNSSPKSNLAYSNSEIRIDNKIENISKKFYKECDQVLIQTTIKNNSHLNLNSDNELLFNDQINTVFNKVIECISKIDVDESVDLIKDLKANNETFISIDGNLNNSVDKVISDISLIDIKNKVENIFKLSLNSSSTVFVDDLNKVAKIKSLRNYSSINISTTFKNQISKEITTISNIDINSESELVLNKNLQKHSFVDLKSISDNSFNKIAGFSSKINGIDSFEIFKKSIFSQSNSTLMFNNDVYQPKIKKVFEKDFVELESTVLFNNGYDVNIENTRTLILPKNIPSGIELQVGEKSLQVNSVKLFANSSGRDYPVMIWDVDTKQTIWIQMIKSTVSDGWTKFDLDNPILLKPNKNYVLSTIAYEGLEEREIKHVNIIPNNELLKVVQYRQGDPDYVDYFPENYLGQDVEIYGVVDIECSRIVYSSPKIVTDIIPLGEMYSIEDSKIEWTENLPIGTSINIETSIDNGDTWQIVTNKETIPSLPKSTIVKDKELLVKQTLTSNDEEISPSISDLKIHLFN